MHDWYPNTIILSFLFLLTISLLLFVEPSGPDTNLLVWTPIALQVENNQEQYVESAIISFLRPHESFMDRNPILCSFLRAPIDYLTEMYDSVLRYLHRSIPAILSDSPNTRGIKFTFLKHIDFRILSASIVYLWHDRAQISRSGKNKILITVNNISIKALAHFQYKSTLLGFLQDSGVMTLEFDKMTIVVEIKTGKSLDNRLNSNLIEPDHQATVSLNDSNWILPQPNYNHNQIDMYIYLAASRTDRCRIATRSYIYFVRLVAFIAIAQIRQVMNKCTNYLIEISILLLLSLIKKIYILYISVIYPSKAHSPSKSQNDNHVFSKEYDFRVYENLIHDYGCPEQIPYEDFVTITLPQNVNLENGTGQQ